MPPWFLQVFYGACGITIAALLYRIWTKNQTKNMPDSIAEGLNRTSRMAEERAAQATRQASLATKNAASQVPAIPVPPVPAAVSIPVSNAAESVQHAARNAGTAVMDGSRHAASAVADATSQRVPAPYIAGASASILKTPAHATWEDRKLLEHRGVMGQSDPNALPRVLPSDVPGVSDEDRVFGSNFNPALASLLPESSERMEQVRKDLHAAGEYSPHAVENLAAIRYVWMMLALIVFGALLLIVPQRLEIWMICGLVAGPLLGWALPMLGVRAKAEKRRQEIQKGMPDLLDMLNMCVSQGLTLPDSLKRILREFQSVYPALSQELAIVTDQARITNMHTALDNFSKRIDLPEVHSFTSLLIQTERMGTSVSDALTTYSDSMRESLRQRTDEAGNRATFQLLFPTVLCLMPAVYIFLLGPAINGLNNFYASGSTDSINNNSQAVQQLNDLRAQARVRNQRGR